MHVKYSAPTRQRFLFAVCVMATVASATAPIVTLISCTRKTSPKSPQKTVEVQPLSPQTSTPVHIVAPARISSPAPPQTAKAFAAPLMASMHGFGLKVPSIPRMPQDYSLGPLQSHHPEKGDESDAFMVARSFVEGIASGKLDKKILLPEARDALVVLLTPPSPDPGSPTMKPYRLGAISLEGSSASLRLRLSSAVDATRQEGLLSLRKSEDLWYIEAFALDPPVSGAMAFNPDSSAQPR